jgi:hypothetical protein
VPKRSSRPPYGAQLYLTFEIPDVCPINGFLLQQFQLKKEEVKNRVGQTENLYFNIYML